MLNDQILFSETRCDQFGRNNSDNKTKFVGLKIIFIPSFESNLHKKLPYLQMLVRMNQYTTSPSGYLSKTGYIIFMFCLMSTQMILYEPLQLWTMSLLSRTRIIYHYVLPVIPINLLILVSNNNHNNKTARFKLITKITHYIFRPVIT